MSDLHPLIQYLCLLCATCICWDSAQTIGGESNANSDKSYFFYQRPEYPRDCNEIKSECRSSNSNGVYLIKPDGYSEPFEVFCNSDVDSGGWTVVQRRIDGSVLFDRSWEEYKDGFGFLSSEFWLGNEKLAYITNQANYELRVDMVLSNGSSFYIEYNAFRITDEWGRFALNSVGEYSGNGSSVITYCSPGTVFKNFTCEAAQDTEVFTDCYHAYQSGHGEDGLFTIQPSGWTGEPFKVLCNMSIDDGGWTVLQRRVNGSVNFEKNWDEYKTGFGILEYELWLGNDKIYSLTNQKDYELRMDMVNLDGNAYFAKYNLFRTSDENSNYQLVALGDYDATSTTGFDAMQYHRNQSFSTPDRDNDPYSGYNCAAIYRGRWWYHGNIGGYYCYYCDFNRANLGSSSYGPYWYNLPGSNYLMYTDMKIRPV